MPVDDQHRTIINVEDYPDIDTTTEDGRDELCALAASMARGHMPVHYVFMRGGKFLGEMICTDMFADNDKLH